LRWGNDGRKKPGIGHTIHPAFAEQIDLVGQMAAVNGDEPEFYTTAKQEHYAMVTPKFDSSELEMFDKITAPFQIDGRTPFLDRRLVEFTYGVPWSQKTWRGEMRYLTRRAFAGRWPKAVTRRSGKGNMGDNFTRRLWSENRDYIADIIFDPPDNLGRYVNLPKLQRIFNDPDVPNFRKPTLMIYEAVTVGAWLRRLNDPLPRQRKEETFWKNSPAYNCA
jgi:asparagine synthase (glutamine-hydrolysing)